MLLLFCWLSVASQSCTTRELPPMACAEGQQWQNLGQCYIFQLQVLITIFPILVDICKKNVKSLLIHINRTGLALSLLLKANPFLCNACGSYYSRLRYPKIFCIPLYSTQRKVWQSQCDCPYQHYGRESCSRKSIVSCAPANSQWQQRNYTKERSPCLFSLFNIWKIESQLNQKWVLYLLFILVYAGDL